MTLEYIEKRKKDFVDKYYVKPNGCWQWLGCTTRKGYGRFPMNGNSNVEAHRVSLFFYSGVPLFGVGKDCDHLCRNRSCVNPKHMELVDRGTNVMRGKGACAINARKTHCKNGHKLNEKRVCTLCRQKTNRAAYERRKQRGF